MESKVIARNKKAFHDFEIIEKFLAGIQLFGTEIKSLRGGKASLNDSFCQFVKRRPLDEFGELFIKMHINEYSHGTYNNHDPKRERKLLLKGRELKKLERQVSAKGMAVVPLCIFLNERGLAKVEIALGKGKKMFDKREDMKDKDNKRELDRVMKKYN